MPSVGRLPLSTLPVHYVRPGVTERLTTLMQRWTPPTHVSSASWSDCRYSTHAPAGQFEVVGGKRGGWLSYLGLLLVIYRWMAPPRDIDSSVCSDSRKALTGVLTSASGEKRHTGRYAVCTWPLPGTGIVVGLNGQAHLPDIMRERDREWTEVQPRTSAPGFLQHGRRNFPCPYQPVLPTQWSQPGSRQTKSCMEAPHLRVPCLG